MTPTPPPIWQYMAQGHQWFQQHQLEAWGGLAAAVCDGAHCQDRQAPEAPGPHVAWLGPVVHGARGTEVRALAGPWRRAGGRGWGCLDG